MKLRWQDLLSKLTGKPPLPEDGPDPFAAAGMPAAPEPPKPPDSPAGDETTEPQPSPEVPEAHAALEGVQSMQQSQPESDPKQGVAPYQVVEGGSGPALQARGDAVSRVYAQALLEMAEEAGTVDDIADEVDQILELTRAQPELKRLLETPAISADQRKSLIDRIFQGRVSDAMWRFLQVVNAKGRSAVLPDLLTMFQDLLAAKRGIVEVNVTVARRLERHEAEQVAQRIGEAIGKWVVLHQFVDESLIGGMVIRIGDRVIDGSVATQLQNMRKQLVERGRERAREEGAGGQGMEG